MLTIKPIFYDVVGVYNVENEICIILESGSKYDQLIIL